MSDDVTDVNINVAQRDQRKQQTIDALRACEGTYVLIVEDEAGNFDMMSGFCGRSVPDLLEAMLKFANDIAEHYISRIKRG